MLPRSAEILSNLHQSDYGLIDGDGRDAAAPPPKGTFRSLKLLERRILVGIIVRRLKGEAVAKQPFW